MATATTVGLIRSGAQQWALQACATSPDGRCIAYASTLAVYVFSLRSFSLLAVRPSN